MSLTWRQQEAFKLVGYVLLVLVIVSGAVYAFMEYRDSAETITIRVDDKEKDVYTDEDGTTWTYYIYTPHETFEVRDNKIFGDPDIYKQLRVGKTYEVGVIGWNVKWALNRNINLIYREIGGK